MIQPLLEDPMGVIALYLMGGSTVLLALYGVLMIGLNVWAAVSLAKERRRAR